MESLVIADHNAAVNLLMAVHTPPVTVRESAYVKTGFARGSRSSFAIMSALLSVSR